MDSSNKVQMDYKLEPAEVLEAFQSMPSYKKRRIRLIIELSILLVIVIFSVIMFFTQGNSSAIIYGILSLILGAILLCGELLSERSSAKKYAKNQEISLEVSRDALVLEGKNGKFETLFSDGISTKETRNLYIFLLKNEQMILLPKRVVEEKNATVMMKEILIGVTS